VPSADGDLSDRKDEEHLSDVKQQKRSKHYVRFGRSPVDIDEYFYDDDDDQSDFIAPRSLRRHYVRFGRDSGNGRHYVRFGRNGAADPESAAKRGNRHYVRFGRDQSQQLENSDAEKRAHYVRFGRGSEFGMQDEVDVSDNDLVNKANKRPNYVRFG